LLVDSHCHLNYLDDPDNCLERARERGVLGVLCVGVDQSGIQEVLQLAARHSDVWASVGLHPESATTRPEWIEEHLDAPGVVAVGETGLDYHQVDDGEKQAVQRECFAYHLEQASQLSLPVVVHSRAAESDTLAIIRDFPDVIGVLHCFTESWDLAGRALDLGYYVSISGIVTFKNAQNVREVARRVPAERLLVETDAPWLAPVPHRGRTNEPAYVESTARYLAQLRGCDFETLACATTENFHRLFSAAQNTSSSSR
jgi:TatD DNase family protein